MARRLGVDVSHWNREHERTVLSPLDWEGLRNAGVEFGFAKATQGTSFVDSRYEHNEGEMRRLGIIPGAYHWIEHGQPERECQHFFETIDYSPSRPLRIALDVEDHRTTQEDVLRWLREQRQLARGIKVFTYTGKPPWLRIGNPRINTYGKHPLWHAAYGENREYPIEDVDLAAVKFAVDYGDWKRASIRQIGSRITFRGRRLDVNVELAAAA